MIQLSGIDATLSWNDNVGPGSVFVSLNGNYMIDFSLQPFTGAPKLNYIGTQGTGLKGVNFGSAFQYRIFGTVGYTWGPANLSLQCSSPRRPKTPATSTTITVWRRRRTTSEGFPRTACST